MSVTDWSIAPDANAIADPTIPALDGVSARKLPDLVRGVMAKMAAYVLDQSGALTTTGTANAYVLNTNSGISVLKPGVSVTFIADRDSTAVPFLNVDGTGPKPIQTPSGVPIAAQAIKAGLQYTVLWNAAAGPYPAGWRLKGAAAVLNGNDFSALGHTAIADNDYAALASDVQIGFVKLTAPRIVTLPDVDTYPIGQVLYIGDETGFCSLDFTITIMANPSTGDLLAGGEVVLAYPYLGQAFRRGAANLWIPVKA